MSTLLDRRAATPAAPEALPGGKRAQRRRLRRRFLLAGLAPLLAALVLSGKVGTMVLADQAGRDAYGQGNFAQAVDSFGSNATVNVFEPWIAPYDEGTAQFQVGDYAEAEDQLEKALSLAPAGQVCRVRINLALTYEAVGDTFADNRPFAALRAYQEGADTLAEGTCLEESVARGIDSRLREKLSRRGPAVEPGAAEADAAARQLALLNTLAERLSRRAEQRQRDKQDDAASPFGDAQQGGVPVYQW